MQPNERQLLLTHDQFGFPTEATFQLPWELWGQLRMMLEGSGGPQILGGAVPDDQAQVMADWIDVQQAACEAAEAMPPSDWTTADRMAVITWGMHLHLWGDCSRRGITSFAEFLRGGGFEVVEPVEAG